MALITSIIIGATAAPIMLSQPRYEPIQSCLYSYVYIDNSDSMEKINTTSKLKNKLTILKNKNQEKIESMRKLQDNWDGAGAEIFSKDLLDRVELLLRHLGNYQPNIFPTSDSSVQLEFYNGDDNYLQFIVSESNVEMYVTDGVNQDNDIVENFSFDRLKIVNIVRSFYNNVFDFKDTIWTSQR